MPHSYSITKTAVAIALAICWLSIVNQSDTWAYSIEHHLHYVAPQLANISPHPANEAQQEIFNHITDHLQYIEIPFVVRLANSTNTTAPAPNPSNKALTDTSHIYSHIVADAETEKKIVIITDLDPSNANALSIVLYLTSMFTVQPPSIDIFVLYLTPNHEDNRYIQEAYHDFLSKTSLTAAHNVLLFDSTNDTDLMQIDIGATPVPSHNLLKSVLESIPTTIPYAFPSFWRSGSRIQLTSQMTSQNPIVARSPISAVQQQDIDNDVDIVHISIPALPVPTTYGVESFDEHIIRYHYANYLQSVINTLAETTTADDINYIVIPFVSGTNLINDTNIVAIITIILFCIIVMVFLQGSSKRALYLSLLRKSLHNVLIFTVAVFGSLSVSSYILHLFIAQAHISNIVFENAIWFFLLLMCIWYWIGCGTTYLLLGTIRITSGRAYGVYAVVASGISALCFTAINAYFAIIALCVAVGTSAVLNIKSIDAKRNTYMNILLAIATLIGCLLIVSGNDLAHPLVTTATRTNIVMTLFVLPLYLYNNRLLIAGRSIFQLPVTKVVIAIATLAIIGQISYLVL